MYRIHLLTLNLKLDIIEVLFLPILSQRLVILDAIV